MTKNRAPTPVYLDPGMHPGLEVKGLKKHWAADHHLDSEVVYTRPTTQQNHRKTIITRAAVQL